LNEKQTFQEVQERKKEIAKKIKSLERQFGVDRINQLKEEAKEESKKEKGLIPGEIKIIDNTEYIVGINGNLQRKNPKVKKKKGKKTKNA